MSMTLDRAYKIIEEQKNAFLDEYIDYGSIVEAYDIALKAIKDLEPIIPKSKKIGFNDITIEPDGTKDEEISYITNYYCGNCGEDIRKYNNFCHICGRKINWEKIND